MILHRPVLFVGGRPDPKCKSRLAPMVGTKGYRTLLRWIFIMDLDINLVEVWNLYGMHGNPHPLPPSLHTHKVIALGTTARKRLKEIQELYHPELKFSSLPLPSETEFELTDHHKTLVLLSRCKAYIYKF